MGNAARIVLMPVKNHENGLAKVQYPNLKLGHPHEQIGKALWVLKGAAQFKLLIN